MERCEILLSIIERYDSEGDYLHPSRLVTLPEVAKQMGYVCAYKHIALLEERGKIVTAKANNGYKPKPIMSGKRDTTTYEYAHRESTKVRSWDPNKKLIFIEELATMSNDEKDRLFAKLDSIDQSLYVIAEAIRNTTPTTKADQIKNREVKA